MGETKVVILCGGKSSRMGEDKALLMFEGQTFLEHLVEEFSGCERVSDSERIPDCENVSGRGNVNDCEITGDRILVSVGDKNRYAHLNLQEVSFVEDRYKDCGPLGGLHAICEKLQGQCDQFMVTTVDLPLADQDLKRELETFMAPGIDAVIPVDVDGRLHPLCAIYRTSMAEKVEQHLIAGNYRVQSLLRELRVCYVPVQKLTGGSRKLRNVNTPEDYQNMLDELQNAYIMAFNKHGIPIVSIAAYSGSGKTSFYERLIRELIIRGVRTAVLKHDVHGFSIDHEGKDTFRFAKAGADPVMICSDGQAARMDYHYVPERKLLDGIEGVDLILIEGFKRKKFPKILLHREDASQPVAMDFTVEQPILIVSDRKEWPEVSCPVLSLDDIAQAADFLMNRIQENH